MTRIAFAQSIYQRALDASQRLGDALLDDFTQRMDETVALFRRVQPDQWDNLVYWPPGPMSVDVLLTQRIAELTMHGWDIRSKLEDRITIYPMAASGPCSIPWIERYAGPSVPTRCWRGGPCATGSASAGRRPG